MPPRKSYTTEFKVQVIEHAKTHKLIDTAQHFQLNTSLIYRWIERQGIYYAAPAASKRIGSGRRAMYPDQERQLAAWIRERGGMQGLTAKMMQDRFRAMLPAGSTFCASYSWLENFLARHALPALEKVGRGRGRKKRQEGEEGQLDGDVGEVDFAAMANFLASTSVTPSDLVSTSSAFHLQ